MADPGGHQHADVYQYGLRVAAVRGFGTADAVTTNYTYDPATLGVTSTTITAAGDSNTHQHTATFDAHGHPLTQTDGMGREIDTTYNTFGDPLTVTGPNPSAIGPARITTTYSYDTKGNLISVSRPWYTSATAPTKQQITYQRADPAHPGDVTGETDALGNTTARSYDAVGNPVSVTTPQGRTTTSTFDAVGWRRTTTTAAGQQAGVDPARFTTTFDYDAAGRNRSTSVAAPNGPLVTAQSYDLDGRLHTRTDPLGNVTTYDHDLAGQLVTVTRPDGSTQQTGYWPDGAVKTQIDGRGKTTSYTEDSLGRVGSVTDPLNRTTSYTYDVTDSILTTIDAQHQTTTNTYDAGGALSTTSYSDGTTPTVTRTYNPAGLPATMVDGTGTTTYSYDSLGRLTQQSAQGRTVGYSYNLRGQVTTLTYPSGNAVTRTFDADGPMHSVTDWLGGTTTFGYDANGALGTVTAPNGVTTTTGRDDSGRTTSTTITKGATTLGTLGYELDNANEILAETGSGLGPNRSFGYDSVGRLTADNGTAYGYDAADNLTADTGVMQTYDDASQLATVAGSPGTTFTYDQRGNRKTAAGASTISYSYDQANRLTSYTSTTGTATYTYDGDGLRATRTVDGATRTFGYDTVEGLPLILVDGTSSYIYGPSGLPVEQIAIGASTATYLHTDQLGSVRLLTDAAGGIAGTASYSAYGVRGGTSTSPLGFAGQYTDAESGLIYLRARFYDPATGGFLTLDPAVTSTRSPYTYAGGNPITGSDLSGLHCWSFHCLLNDTAKITTVVQVGADAVALLTGAIGLEPVAAVAFAVSQGAGTINVVATCADALTGAKGRASGGDCLANAAISLGTFGIGKVVAQPQVWRTGGKIVEQFTRDQRAAAATANMFGDLLGWARGWKYQPDCPDDNRTPKWEPAR